MGSDSEQEARRHRHAAESRVRRHRVGGAHPRTRSRRSSCLQRGRATASPGCVSSPDWPATCRRGSYSSAATGVGTSACHSGLAFPETAARNSCQYRSRKRKPRARGRAGDNPGALSTLGSVLLSARPSSRSSPRGSLPSTPVEARVDSRSGRVRDQERERETPWRALVAGVCAEWCAARRRRSDLA